MDGITGQNSPIIVLGATNRVDSLDEALIRPGRFDRVVEVTKPNYADRVELVTISLRSLKYTSDMDVCRIARGTRGFSGAELANLFNEAMILAANEDRDAITMLDVDNAFDNIVLGRPKTNMDIPQEELWRTAVHEAGHCAGFLYNNDMNYAIHKVSVVPRSHTLGFVYPILLQEHVNPTILSMKAEITMLLCGGISERRFEFDHSTGLFSDIQKARALAYEMVVYYGMGQDLSYISYANIDTMLPNDIATKVHQEIEKIIVECREKAKELIATHKQEIEKIAKLLLEKGTVVGNEIYELVGLPLPEGIEFSFS
jgi:cell division protease FtsH